MLSFVGLGLSPGGISREGFQEAKDADKVFIELYTSLIPGLELEEMESEIDNKIRVLKREDIEQDPEELLESAKKEKVVLFVLGGPMVATTHVDLRLRAEKRGIETRIIHGPSIQMAASGLAGLQSYKFGRTATIPFPDKPSKSPYEVIEQNKNLGLHTLLLLDIEAEKERYLTASSAINYLLDFEEKLGRDVFTPDTLCVVIARAGSPDYLVSADRAGNLVRRDFGSPPHVLIVPGKLHFLEEEALEVFAGADKEVLKNNVER